MVKEVKIKTEHVAQMRTLFEVLKEILMEATIEFIQQPAETEEDTTSVKKKNKNKKASEGEPAKPAPFSGMRILAIAPSNAFLLCLKLHAHKFMEFVCKYATYDIGVNMGALHKMLKSTDHEDELEMCVDNDDKQSLLISVNNSGIRRSTEFKLKLLDISKPNIKLPPVEPDVMITMSASEFHKLCKNMIQIGPYLEVKCTNNTLIFSCEGSNSSCETKYTTDDNGIKISILNPDKRLIFQGVYELKHINIFSKCASLSPDLQLLMKVNKYPLCIQYTVATLGDFVACMSPIIDSQAKNSFDEAADLYKSDDEDVALKDEFADED